MENIKTLPIDQAQAYLRPHPGMVSHRLTTPIAITYIDTDKISFERLECASCNLIFSAILSREFIIIYTTTVLRLTN